MADYSRYPTKSIFDSYHLQPTRDHTFRLIWRLVDFAESEFHLDTDQFAEAEVRPNSLTPPHLNNCSIYFCFVLETLLAFW